MKKWHLFTSLGANAALMALLVLVLRPEESTPMELPHYTQQELAKTVKIESGMSRQEVIALLGEPISKVFVSNIEEWYYCQTGSHVDEYAAIEIYNEEVSGLRRYTVSWLDVVFKHTSQPTEALINASGLGDCRLTVGGVDGSHFFPNKKIHPIVNAVAD